jgi:sortase A
MKKWLAIAMLIAGGSLLGHGTYMQAKAWLAQVLIEQAWQQALQTPNARVKPWFYADSYVTAQIKWPTYDKTLTVLSGASGRNLAFAPSHYLASGQLGSQDGVLIAGHNDTHFAFLQQVKVGDLFSMQLQNAQVQRYKVTGIEVIQQSQHAFLNTPGLYLLTCYPFDSLVSGTDFRLLVSAQLVSPEMSSTSTTTS